MTKKGDLYDSDFEALGSAAFAESSAFATSAQGTKADSAVQPGDNVSELVNDAGYLTEAEIGSVISVNGQDGAVVLTKTDLDLGSVDNTSDADKPVSTAQQTALDLKADLSILTQSNGKIAIFDSTNGSLTNIDSLRFNSYGGFDFYKQENLTELGSPTYIEINRSELNLDPTENVENYFYVLNRNVLSIDRNNLGFDFGNENTNQGGAGMFSSNFYHGGSGLLRQYQHRNDYVQFGEESPSVAGRCQGFTLEAKGVVIRPDYTIDIFQCESTSIELRNGSLVDSFSGNGIDVVLRSNSEITNYTNLTRANLDVESGSEANNGQLLQLRLGNEGSVGYWDGINLNFDGNGSALGSNAIQITYGNNAYQQGPTGVNVNMGNYDTTTQRRICFAGSNGALSIQQEIQTAPNMFFDQGNILFNLFHVTAGNPITSTAFISNNFSTGFQFDDDMDEGIMGLGASGVGFVGQLAVAAGKTASLVNFSVGGASIPDLPGLGGTVLRANVFNAIGIVDQGGSNDVVIEEVCGFHMPAGGLGNAVWGIDIANPAAENRLAKSLVIGESADTVSNSGVALELADKKAFKLTGLTITERDALTPSFGWIIAIDDGATKEIQFYNGSSWVTL